MEKFIWSLDGLRKIKFNSIKEFMIVQKGEEDYVVEVRLSGDEFVEIKKCESLGEAQGWINSI